MLGLSSSRQIISSLGPLHDIAAVERYFTGQSVYSSVTRSGDGSVCPQGGRGIFAYGRNCL